MNTRNVYAAILATSLMGASVLPAQVGGFASPDLMDDFNSQSPSGGFNPSTFTDRARDAADQANNSGFGQPAAGGFGDPAAGGGFGDPGAGGGFGDPAAGGFGDPSAGGFAPPGEFVPPEGQAIDNAAAYGTGFAVPTLRAVSGVRIFDAVTKEIIADARPLQILPTAASSYFDDGRTGYDYEANDNIYTNISIRRDFIAPEVHQIKSKILNLLEYTENLDPMSFFQVRVATTEPISTLPKMTELEEKRDLRLEEWATEFLRPYRVDPESLDSAFIPTYLPPPPFAPIKPLPPNFSPRPVPEDENQQGEEGEEGEGPASGDVFDDPVTGKPIGNASSRYF